jgi:hypothetical protein
MSLNPEMTAELRTQMEDIIATGVCTYALEFTRELIPDFADPDMQDCVVGGFAQAISRYQQATKQPIAFALALALLDIAKE